MNLNFKNTSDLMKNISKDISFKNKALETNATKKVINKKVTKKL